VRIAVVGAGGIGAYFGGRLVESGADVTFLARGRHLDALRRDGLRLESIAGDVELPRIQATDDPHSIGPVDAVLVCVKAWQIGEAARLIAPIVSADTLVLPLQNGVEAPDDLASVLGPDAAAGGLCWIVSELVAPGHVVHRGADPAIVFGELDNRRSSRVVRLEDVLNRAPGVRGIIADDIRHEMWRKFLFIAAVSGVGAVTHVPVGAWRTTPETRALLLEVLGEIDRVADAHGISLGEEGIAEAVAFLDRLPTGAIPSMQRDLMNGVRSELAQQTGAVVRLGDAAGVPVPVNRFLLATLLPLEREARRRAEGQEPGRPGDG